MKAKFSEVLPMSTLAIIYVLLLGVYSFALRADPLFEKTVVREDFQGDGLGQFASYPPAQDIGYEPSITPTALFDSPGGRSLMRVIQPTQNGDLRFGFIKKVDVFASADLRLSFSYRLNFIGENGAIELGIAGADGCRYVKEIRAQSNIWVKADNTLAEFRCGGKPLKAGTGIEAFYITAKLKNADKDITYRFLIDDVALTAEGAVEFKINVPSSERIDPWPRQITTKSYNASEAAAFEVAAPTKLIGVECILKSPGGKTIASQSLFDDGTRGDRRANDNTWTNTSVWKFSTDDSRGVWKALITGRTGGGKTVSTELRFIVGDTKSQMHPRLYFDASDREKLRAKTRDPRLQKAWDTIQAAAKASRDSGNIANGGDVFELLDTEYLLPSLLGYFDAVNRARARISNNAFIAYVTNDAVAAQAAKAALLDVSRWQRWEPPWFTTHGQHTYYPAGQLAADVALGYDLLYDRLTEPERSQVRKALIEKQIIPTYKEYFLDNRAMANTSNWISHTVGGALIAASAIAGDVRPEEDGGKFGLYVNGLLLKFEAHIKASYLPDGSYGEGISYQEFDSETLTAALPALERAFGINYWDTTHILESTAYPLYTMTDPIAASLDMGDTHPPAGHGISPLIFRSKDPVVRWYYNRFDRPSMQQFIFFNDDVKPKSPTEAGMPTSRIFEDKGNAAFRTGWGGDDVVMLFRAGPNFNHHHADQGQFLLTAFGEPLLTEAGWSDYYKDPYYATFFTQAVGHNTVLVDGNPQSQSLPDTPQFAALDDYPRITDSITSDFYDAVSGDLTSVYENRLSRYWRRIVFVKPYYFVLFDDLKANRSSATFDFLLHVPDTKRLTTNGLSAIYKGEKASLAVRSFSDDNLALTLNNGRIPYHIFSAKTPTETPPQPAYLDFHTTKPRTEVQFLTALVPAKNENAAQNLASNMTQFSNANLKGLRVERGQETDLIMFRTGGQNARLNYSGWSTDAVVLTITEKSAALEMFGAQSVRSVRSSDRIIFSSDVIANVTGRYGPNQIDLSSQANAASNFSIFAGKVPARVLVDRNPINANAYRFDSRTNMLSVSVSAGRHAITIIF